jgi:Ca2+-binding RTX toxin-like protein
MISPLGPVITIVPAPADPLAPTQGAGPSDIVARPNGGFVVLYGVGVTELDANLNPVTTSRQGFASVSANGTLVGNTLIESVTNGGVGGRLSAGGGDSYVLVQSRSGSQTSFTLREVNGLGATLDGPRPAIPAPIGPRLNDSLALPGDRTLLVWSDGAAADQQILGRFFDAANLPAGGARALTPAGGATERDAEAALLTNGRIALTYTIASAQDFGDIGVQVRTATGATFSAETRGNVQRDGNQTAPEIAALTSGGFVVGWTDYDGPTGGDGFLRLYDGQGRAVAGAFRLHPAAADDQALAEIVALSGGRFLALWEDDAGGVRIRGQVFDRLGSKVGEAVTLTGGGAPSFFDQGPVATEVANGIVAVAWTRDIEQEGVLARRFDVGAVGTGGDDVLNAATLGRVIEGLGGDDRLTGGVLADVLVGGAGRDTMAGGAGADDFVYRFLSDSTPARAGRDLITGFQRNADEIDLSAIDARRGVGDNDAFRFIGEAAFGAAKGQLRLAYASGNTLVQADVNGDRVADLVIELSGRLALQVGDFIL